MKIEGIQNSTPVDGKTRRPSVLDKKGGRGKKKKRRQTKINKKKLGIDRIKEIGPYQVLSCIGIGAMGTVFKATNKMDGRTHAIKRISMKKIPEIEREGIETEIKMLKYLSHPNVVKFHDVIREDNYLNIVLEYVPNGALTSLLSKFHNKSFSETLTCHYISQVLSALTYLHQQGIIHRDIKGANILADADGIVKLADFGVAVRFRRETSDDDEEKLPAGTMNFMAPEIVKMTSAPTYACDIWSVGATVIELLTGNPPYAEEEGMAICYRIVNDDHPPLPSDSSSACINFLMECFQKDPALRITSKQLFKHHWLEQHREKAAERKSTLSEKDIKAKLLPEAQLISPKSPRSPAQHVTKTATTISINTSKMLEQYAEEEVEFRELEIDDDLELKSIQADDHPQEFDLEFQDDTDTFLLDAGDQLRFDFENTFKEMQTAKEDADVLDVLETLTVMTENNPGQISKILLDIMGTGGTGMMVLMDLLGKRRVDHNIAKGVIGWVNQILADESKYGKSDKTKGGATKFQERLCVLGMTSVILRFCDKKFPITLRIEAANFAKNMCKSNTYTKKMFCACGGIRVLVGLFETPREVWHARTISHPILSTSGYGSRHGSIVDSEIKSLLTESKVSTMKISENSSGELTSVETKEEKLTHIEQKRNDALLMTAIDCIEEIFEINDSPKDDFCRLLCEYGLLPRLTKSFKRLKSSKEAVYVQKVVELLSVFAGADVIVRNHFARRNVVKPLLEEITTLPDNLLEDTIKSLKMICGLKNPTALRQLEEAGIVEVFVELLTHPRRDIYNHLLLCLDMLLDVSFTRTETAVKSGLIPSLLYIERKESTMNQVVRKIMCSVPVASSKVRLELKKNNVIAYYIDLLSKPSWRIHALNALSLWLEEDPEFVGRGITGQAGIQKIATLCSVSVSKRHLSAILPTIQTMIGYSPRVNSALAASSIFVDNLLEVQKESPIEGDPIDVAVVAAATQILFLNASRYSNLLPPRQFRQIRMNFSNIALEAKRLGKVKLWREAENFAGRLDATERRMNREVGDDRYCFNGMQNFLRSCTIV